MTLHATSCNMARAAARHLDVANRLKCPSVDGVLIGRGQVAGWLVGVAGYRWDVSWSQPLRRPGPRARRAVLSGPRSSAPGGPGRRAVCVRRSVVERVGDAGSHLETGFLTSGHHPPSCLLVRLLSGSEVSVAATIRRDRGGAGSPTIGPGRLSAESALRPVSARPRRHHLTARAVGWAIPRR